MLINFAVFILTNMNESRWHRERERDTNILWLWQLCGLACRRLLHDWSNWILYTPTLRPAYIEPGICDIHLPCFSTPIVHLMPNTDNLHTIYYTHNIHT
jgi:hypothetical protein